MINNCVADIREEVIYCPDCDGDGFLRIVDYAEFLDYIVQKYLPRMDRKEPIFRDAMAECRQWKTMGLIRCPRCCGEGAWVCQC